MMDRIASRPVVITNWPSTPKQQDAPDVDHLPYSL